MTAACGQPSTAEPFAMHVFTEQNPEIPEGLRLTDGESWKRLIEMDLGQSDLVLTEERLVDYKWDSQRIFFDEDSRHEFEQLMTLNGYFVVTMGDQPVTAGNIRPVFSSFQPEMPILYYMPLGGVETLELWMFSSSIYNQQPYDLLYLQATENVQQRLKEIDKLTGEDQ